MWVFISFVLFLLLVVAIAKYMTRGDKIEGATGYFLGNRSLTGPVIAGTLLLTNISGEQLIGQSSSGYMYSMQAMGYEVMAGVALVLLALWFLPKYLRLGISTIPELMELRYGPIMRKLVMVLFLFAYVVVYIPSILYTGAVSFSTLLSLNEVLNLNTFATVSVVVAFICIVGLMYIFFGNLKLFAITDTLFGVGLFVGAFSIVGFSLHVLGGGNIGNGINTMLTSHQEKLNAFGGYNSFVPSSTLFTGVMVMHVFYWCTNQTLIQKTLASKNLVEGQKGAIYCAFLKCIGPFYMIIPGIVAFHLFPNIHGDVAYATLIREVLPTAMQGFLAAVFFGAIISSFNGFVTSASTIFTYDLYHFIKPNPSPEESVRVGKTFSLVATCFAGIISPMILIFPEGFYPLLLQASGSYNIPILVAVVMALFTTNVSLTGIIAATAVHAVIYISYYIIGPEFSFIYMFGISVFASMFTALVVSKFYPRSEPFFIPKHNYVDLTPWKHAKLASIILCLSIVGVYLFFSPFGIVKI